jgi:hypothetical protein
MARYFFNVYYGEESYLDDVGDDLPDDIAAWREATSSAAQSLKDLDGRLQPGTDWRMEVTTEDRSILYVIDVKARTRTARSR